MKRAHLSPADRAAIVRAVFALRHRVIGSHRGPTRTCAIALLDEAEAAAHPAGAVVSMPDCGWLNGTLVDVSCLLMKPLEER